MQLILKEVQKHFIIIECGCLLVTTKITTKSQFLQTMIQVSD